MQSPAVNIPEPPRFPAQTPPPAPVSNPSGLGNQNNPVSTTSAPENVICVIGKVTRKTGIFSADLYHLVITDRRLIFARQTKEMQSSDVQPLEQVLKINTYQGDFEDNGPDSMEVITPTEKYKFLIANYFNTQKQLKAVLGIKVK